MRKIKIIFLVFFVISCSKVEHSKVEHINLSKIFKLNSKVNLSEIAKEIEYIQLETDSLSLISVLDQPDRQIKFYNNNFFINAGEILRFSHTGKFLNRIGQNGKGPHEYINADGFTTITKKKDSLIVVFSAAQQKSILYDIEGKYKNDFPISFWPTDLTSIDKNLLFINSIGRRKESNNYALSIMSKDYKSIKKRLLYKVAEKNKNLVLSAFNTSYFYKDTLSYWESNYDTIWRITKDFKKVPKYTIDNGGNKMSVENFTKENVFNFDVFSKYDMIEKIFESSKFIFFKTSNNKRLYHVYYNKETKKSSTVEFKNPFNKGINFSFYNDIDGGVPFWPMGKVSDDKMLMVVYGYEMRSYIKKKKNKDKVFSELGRRNLINLINKSKISDNPILMIVTLKKSNS